MFEFIKKLDYMGKEFKLTIEGSSFKTFFGGLLSIFKACIFLFLCWYYGQDIYKREEPYLLKEEQMLNYFPLVNINNQNFNLAIRVENVDGLLIDDPRIFYYDVIYQTWESDNNGIFRNVYNFTTDMETCSTKHYDNDTLYQHKLYNYKCVENNYTIGGDWGSNSILIPRFFVRQCDNTTEKKYNIKCFTDEEILKLHENYYIDTFTQKNVLNPRKYENPVQNTYNYRFKEFNFQDKNVMKQKITYSTAELYTDIGVLFNETHAQNFLEFESVDIDSSPYNPYLGKYVASLEIYISNNHRIYSRKYKKISDALADVGGIFSFIIVVIDVLFSFYVDNAYATFLQRSTLKLNKLVDDIPDQNELVIVKPYDKSHVNYDNSKDANINLQINYNNQSSDLMIKESSANNKIKILLRNKNLNDKDKEIVLNKEIKQIIEYKRKQQHLEDVYITTVERSFFKYCCCLIKNDKSIEQKDLKYKLFEASDKEINKKIDVLNLIKKLDQFNLIKKIVLNESQCICYKKGN